MMQKLMLVDDSVIWRYVDLLSHASNAEIAELKRDVEAGRASVLDTKERFRDRESSPATTGPRPPPRRSRVAARSPPVGSRTTSRRSIWTAEEDGALGLAKALKLAGLTKSTGEASGSCSREACTSRSERVSDDKTHLGRGGRYLVRVVARTGVSLTWSSRREVRGA